MEIPWKVKVESVESENSNNMKTLTKGKQRGKYNKVILWKIKQFHVIEFEAMTKQNEDAMKSESEKCGKWK